jgi:hypothetical protein
VPGRSVPGCGCLVVWVFAITSLSFVTVCSTVELQEGYGIIRRMSSNSS